MATVMKNSLAIGLLAGALALALLVILIRHFNQPSPEIENDKALPDESSSMDAAAEESLQEATAGPEVETEAVSITQPRLLREYGAENKTAKDDLELVNTTLQRFWLLLKNPDLLRVGSNEEIVEVLTGDNPDNISFISPENEYIDDEGRLLDRWGVPLSFHPLSLTHIEIRSAGPDRDMYTEDDILINAASRSRRNR